MDLLVFQSTTVKLATGVAGLVLFVHTSVPGAIFAVATRTTTRRVTVKLTVFRSTIA